MPGKLGQMAKALLDGGRAGGSPHKYRLGIQIIVNMTNHKNKNENYCGVRATPHLTGHIVNFILSPRFHFFWEWGLCACTYGFRGGGCELCTVQHLYMYVQYVYIVLFFTYFLVLFRKLFKKSKISLYFMIWGYFRKSLRKIYGQQVHSRQLAKRN